ncbi:hypothetical protein D7Y41_11855 [Anaerotruncus sp. 1XD22-93]|nr:hypothetical protein D7Y41_11855 [Anaerotruncus sp. 1XD22-93]
MKAGKAGFTLHKALLQTVLEPVFIIRGCRVDEGFYCPARRKNTGNTLYIARFFNAAGRQKTRSDGIKWL